MAKWLAPALGAIVLVIAVVVGAAIWSQKGDGGSCDHALLTAVLTDAIKQADQRGQVQFDIVRPAHCNEDDLAGVVPEVTRSWHMMPGGGMMRETSHPAAAP
jgi:hypothetical protein